MQHRVIDFGAKRILDRLQIRRVSIRGQLHSICQAALKIVDKMIRRATVACADVPTRNEFRLGVKGRPCPNIAPSAANVFDRADLFLFAPDERPNFIALNPGEIEIAKNLVLVRRAGCAKFDKQLLNRCAVNARHTDRGAERIALN